MWDSVGGSSETILTQPRKTLGLQPGRDANPGVVLLWFVTLPPQANERARQLVCQLCVMM